MSDKEESTPKEKERTRSRSPRSRSHDRRPFPTGRDTNSNDSRSVRCRVFIGNLAADKTSKHEIEEMFGKFGTVASCSLHNNYGFVQFSDEKGADKAVLEMHGKQLFGKRVDVNLAGVRRKTQSKDKYEGAPKKEEVVPPEMLLAGAVKPSNRRHSPRPRSRSPMSRYEELYRRDDPYGGRPVDRFEREPYGMHDRVPYDRPREYPPERRMDPYTFDRREEFYPPRYERDYPPREDLYRRTYDDYRPVARIRPSIDLEIICLSKEESRYAEEVESRLRSIGLVCNIGYPPPELSVLETVDRVARAGTLYAVVVSAQNAQHRSCTLNILHGTRQEHRNMPLDDALSFVARNFDTYLRVLRDPFRGPPPPVYREEPRGYPPAPLADPNGEKKLSTDELTEMIEKLKREKEQREKGASAPIEDSQRRADLESQLRDLRQEVLNREQTLPLAQDPSYPYPAYPSTGGAANSYYSQQSYGQHVYR